MSEKSVAQDMVVGIDYTLRLKDGDVVDQSSAGDPLLYLHGHNNIIPGLERELVGLTVGDSKQVSVSPADGYGDYNEDEVETYPRNMFPPEITADTVVQLRDPETDATFQAVITQIEGDDVTLDFNHPLAGQTLHFDVTIASVRAASAEELSHGHVHG